MSCCVAPVSYSSNVRWFIHSSENQIDNLISFGRLFSLSGVTGIGER